MYARLSKVALVWSVALYASLVVFNNLTDYDSNYEFVEHVLTMDTTFPDNAAMWRALPSPLVHQAMYVLIILAEAGVAVLCWFGGFRLCRTIHSRARFDEAKGIAILGLTLGILLWFVGFIAVGGEWFLMWQSKTWNGREAAFRIIVIIGIVLLYLIHTDEDRRPPVATE